MAMPDHPMPWLGPERATFVLRFWRERQPGAPWWGELEFVQRGERRSFGDVRAALEQLRRWLSALTGVEE